MGKRDLYMKLSLRATQKLSKLMSLLFILFTAALQSKAVILTVGNGTSSNTESGVTPFTTAYEDSRIQYIYLASELIAAGAGPGSIQSIGFNFTILGSPDPAGVNIKIGTTTASTLSGLLTGLTVSYSAASITPVTGWNTYTFNTPFAWNGTDNIVIEVCTDNTTYFDNYGVEATDLGSGNNRTFGYYDDGVAACTMTGGNTATLTDRQSRPNCQFDIIPSATCSGKPVAGTAAASSPASNGMVCPNVTFSLSTSGGTFASGITYDWQSNTGGGWQSTGITTQHYAVSGGITVSTDYRLIVSCTGGTADTSNVVSLAVSLYYSCYCIPSSDCTNDGIVNVTMGTLNNTSSICSGGSGGYSDFKGLGSQVAVSQGQQIAISVTDSINTNPASAGVWIDYDHSGTFDSSEFTFLGTSNAFNGTKTSVTFTATINIPSNALTGLTALRVRAAAYGVVAPGGTTGGPCATGVFGEFEDYLITINPGTPCNSVPAGGTASSSLTSTMCPAPVILSATGYTTGIIGLSFQWQQSTDNSNFTNLGTATSDYVNDTLPSVSQTMYYRLQVTCTNGTGLVGYSDTVSVAFTPVSTFPWLYDVETQNTTNNSSITNDCWSSSPSNTTLAFRWNVDAGGSTPTSSTGPAGAYSGTKYYYTEANQGTQGDSASLVLPSFDISTATAPMLTFYYHMYGYQMGNLIIQANTGSGWVSLDSLVGQQQTNSGSAWLQKTIDLSGVVTTNLQIRFVGLKGSGSRGDMSIDDIAVTSVPLAIRLDQFRAVNRGNFNQLEWTTLSEERSDRFELERSADGSDFERIYEIQAKGSPGQYSYRDREPFSGMNFYRLRLLEANGNAVYSKTVKAFVNRGDFEIEAFPNPVSHMLTVQLNGLPGNDALLQLTDITGKVIYDLKMTGSVQQLDMTGLASGIYLVRYADVNETKTIRVSKQ